MVEPDSAEPIWKPRAACRGVVARLVSWNGPRNARSCRRRGQPETFLPSSAAVGTQARTCGPSEDGRLGRSHATGDRTLTCPRTLPAVLTLAAVVLTATAVLAQELVTAEREAFAAITRAGEAVGRAGDTEALLRAAEQAFAAAPRARAAFAAADRARDAAEAGYRAAYRAALAGAVTCENGYPCTNGRIDPFDGVTAAFASHFELIAAVSAANAVYVDAVGIAGGDAARAGAARVRGLAARMRDLDITVAADRWNTLVGGVSAEIDAGNALHRRATEARDAADRAVVGDVDRVMETLSTAATRLARQSSLRGGGARGAGGIDAADAVASAAADRTDAALRTAVDAAREGLEALRAHIVKALTSVQDVSADEVAGSATAALAAAPEPAEDFEGWVRALNAAARAVEQAAADAAAAAHVVPRAGSHAPLRASTPKRVRRRR